MKYRGTIYRLGDLREEHPIKPSELEPGESIKVVDEAEGCTLFTVYRPPRRKDESPIEYYKRTGCVDDRYQFKHNGRYYCNPAHCRKTWTNKKKRDEHLDMAYAALM
jgi:hypothetical protein